jgi:hypothetical protein
MESKPQGEQIDEWVKEIGKSERYAVMAWIWAKRCPTRKWADFRLVLNHENPLYDLIFMVRIDGGSKSTDGLKNEGS